MTTEFPKDRSYLGKDRSKSENVKFNKDKADKGSEKQETQITKSEPQSPPIQHISLPPEQVLNHLAATAGLNKSNLQHAASLNLFNKMMRGIETVIEKEFPNQNLSSQARERIALGVLNRLMDNQ